MKSVMPLTSACASRFSSGCSRHASSSSFFSDSPPNVAAIVSMRSVASARRLSTRSSTCLAQLRVELLVHRELAGVDDRHVEAGLDRVIEEDRVHRLADARRRAERERQVRHAARDLRARQLRLDAAHRLDEVDRVGSCSSMPVPIVRMFGSKMMSSGGNPTCSVRILYARLRDRRAGDRRVVAWPVSSNAITTTAAPNLRTIFAWRMNSASPSLSEIELTTPLPCRHSRPASITENFDESTITGMRAMSGSARDQVQEPLHRGDAVEHALVHADVEDVRAALDLLARDRDGLVVLVVFDQAAEHGRAGDVRALADHDEVRLRRDRQRLEAGGGAGVIVSGSSPTAACRARLRPCGATPSTAARIAAMCSGRVPQQPPTRLSMPSRAKLAEHLRPCARACRRSRRTRSAGRRSDSTRRGMRRDARELGDVRPHVVGAERAVDADREQVGVADRVVERLDGLARQRAARLVGNRHRSRSPARGARPARTAPRSRRARPCSSACRCASRSGADRRRPRSARAPARRTHATSSWNVTARAPGSLTSGDSEADFVVGPIEPATQRGRPSSFMARSAARRATRRRRD